MLKAVTRSARQIDERVAAVNSQRAAQSKQPVTIAGFFDHHATPADLEVLVEESDFELARKELVPSVSYEELRHYERVRDQFEGGPKEEDAKPVVDEGMEMQTVSAGNAQGSDADRGFARARFNELMARRTSGRNGVPQTNGGDEQAAAGSGDDDDYVIRTDRLTINGEGEGRSSSRSARGGGKGKGKGKGRSEVVDGADDGGQGEDLYD